MVEPAQNPAIWLVQSISGAKAPSLRAIVRLATFVAVARTARPAFRTPRCFETAGCETPARAVEAPDRLLSFAAQPFERARRVGSASVLKEHIVSVRHMGSITQWLLIIV